MQEKLKMHFFTLVDSSLRIHYSRTCFRHQTPYANLCKQKIICISQFPFVKTCLINRIDLSPIPSLYWEFYFLKSQ